MTQFRPAPGTRLNGLCEAVDDDSVDAVNGVLLG